jgi:hypothetical protein
MPRRSIDMHRNIMTAPRPFHHVKTTGSAMGFVGALAFLATVDATEPLN